MKRIGARSVWNDHNVMRRCHCSNSACLCKSTHPRYIWLKNIDGFAINEFTETISRILVFACGDQSDTRQSSFHLGIAIIIIWWEDFFNPLDTIRLQCFREFNCVRHCQRHVAVQCQWEFRSNLFAVLFEDFNILTEALISCRWTVRAWNLAANKSELLGQVGTCGSAVHWETILRLSTKKRIHRFSTNVSKKVPECQINSTNSLEWQSLSSIIQR
mmetsp:Transcript_132961/g.187904  ORF Transcript_132961/g.187904 Transcript_132961/m.187904 type:complete len:216 (+) Transcript_132961:292-939(+)